MDVKSFPGRLAMLLVVISLPILIGCGGSGDASSDKKSDASDKSASLDPEKLLVGTWYGKARLNQELLQKKLNTISDPAERQRLAQVASTFQTTEIGAEYRPDGTMMLDIRINASGNLLRDSTRGNWQTVKVQDNAIFIETTESLPQGGTETNQVRYQFEQDGNMAIMVAPTSEQLADCHPVFVFERIKPAAVADGADKDALK